MPWNIARRRGVDRHADPRTTDPQSPAPTLLWMECGACSGESMAILGAEGRGRRGDTLPAFLEDHGERTRFSELRDAA